MDVANESNFMFKSPTLNAFKNYVSAEGSIYNELFKRPYDSTVSLLKGSA